MVMDDLENGSGFNELECSADVEAENGHVGVAGERTLGGFVEFFCSPGSSDGVLVAAQGVAELRDNHFAYGGGGDSPKDTAARNGSDFAIWLE